jgi:hypothetical protein
MNEALGGTQWHRAWRDANHDAQEAGTAPARAHLRVAYEDAKQTS